MAIKTQPTSASVDRFIAAVEDETRRADCRTVLAMMKQATGLKPEMWGSSIVGFGRVSYRYQSGQSGEWFLTGFSPRKQDLTLYIVPGVKRYPALLKQLGKHRTGVSCLYIKRLADVDLEVLRQLIEASLPARDG